MLIIVLTSLSYVITVMNVLENGVIRVIFVLTKVIYEESICRYLNVLLTEYIA